MSTYDGERERSFGMQCTIIDNIKPDLNEAERRASCDSLLSVAAKLSATIDSLPNIARLQRDRDQLLAAAKFAIAESDAERDAPMSWAAHTNLQAAIAAADGRAP